MSFLTLRVIRIPEIIRVRENIGVIHALVGDAVMTVHIIRPALPPDIEFLLRDMQAQPCGGMVP